MMNIRYASYTKLGDNNKTPRQVAGAGEAYGNDTT